MKKYCLLICGAGVAILSYTQINMHSPRNIDLLKVRMAEFVKIERHYSELKKDTSLSVGYPPHGSPSHKFVR